MSSYTPSASDDLSAKKRAAIRVRWNHDREGLPHHVAQVVSQAHLLTPDEREQLVSRLASLGITTEVQKEDVSPAA